jgi:hypothetical protein
LFLGGIRWVGVVLFDPAGRLSLAKRSIERRVFFHKVPMTLHEQIEHPIHGGTRLHSGRS